MYQLNSDLSCVTPQHCLQIQFVPLLIFPKLYFYNFVILVLFFFFNDTATTEIYTLSLHDALPIFGHDHRCSGSFADLYLRTGCRSEEHTSELQSPCNLVCRLLLEKKNILIICLSFLTVSCWLTNC